MSNPNIIPHKHHLSQVERSLIKNHQPVVIWLTGLSGSGKSTIANSLEEALNQNFHAHTYLLDGDNIRKGLNSDLGFSAEDRDENIRRIGEVAKLMVDAGLIVITAFISPFIKERQKVRNLMTQNRFIEVFVDCPLEVCENRDPKGLYKKARNGLIPEFTGVNSPYEAPLNPEIILNSDKDPVTKNVQSIIEYLFNHDLLEK